MATQMDTNDWIEEGTDSVAGCVRELIKMIEWFNIDYFVVEHLGGEGPIQIVLHAGAVIMTDDGYKPVSETQEYKDVSEKMKELSPGKPTCSSIVNRTQFRSFIQSLFSNVRMIDAGMDFLWPFHGWTQ